jgi:hypothetical protein
LDIASIFEDTLGLYYWDSLWLDALSTCSEGTYTRDLETNTFSLPICHLSEFAVLGQSLQFFIPFVQVNRSVVCDEYRIQHQSAPNLVLRLRMFTL